jgi:hypothetical protein
MTTKHELTMNCTPEMKRKLHALAKRSGCSANFLVEACFRTAIECFDGNTTDLSNLLAKQGTKPKERHSASLTVRLPPDVYEGLKRLHLRTGAAVRARRRHKCRELLRGRPAVVESAHRAWNFGPRTEQQ